MFIQSLLSHYTSSVFLASFGWVLCFGFMMNIFVVLGLTKLSAKSVALMTYKAHLKNVGIAALFAPLFASLFSFLLSFLSAGCAGYFCCECATFLWMALCLYVLSSYFFCTTFATVACDVIQKWLLAANAITVVIGFFMLKAWGLL